MSPPVTPGKLAGQATRSKARCFVSSLAPLFLLAAHVCEATPRNPTMQEDLSAEASMSGLFGSADLGQAGRVRTFQNQLRAATNVLRESVTSPGATVESGQQEVVTSPKEELHPSSFESVDTDSHHSCAQELRAKLRNSFGRVVLVINYNENKYARNTSAFWRKLYGSFFLDVVQIGPHPDKDLGILARGPSPYGWSWQNQYWGLPRIMSRYPQAEGFLYTNDDVVINYWNLLGADKSRLWLPNDVSKAENAQFPFDTEVRIEPEYEANRIATRQAALSAYEAMPQENRQQYKASIHPTRGVYQKRVCDIFFIPRRFVEAFSFDLLPVFREARVPHEVAIPTMFYALDHPDNYDTIFNGVMYRWEHYNDDPKTREGYNPEEFWSRDLPAFHPWKVADERLRRRLVLAISRNDSCICQDFGSMCEQ